MKTIKKTVVSVIVFAMLIALLPLVAFKVQQAKELKFARRLLVMDYVSCMVTNANETYKEIGEYDEHAITKRFDSESGPPCGVDVALVENGLVNGWAYPVKIDVLSKDEIVFTATLDSGNIFIIRAKGGVAVKTPRSADYVSTEFNND